MGREGENLPLARASRLAWSTPYRASGATLGGLLGRSIVVRERKGSRPWRSPAANGLRGRALAPTGSRRALGASVGVPRGTPATVRLDPLPLKDLGELPSQHGDAGDDRGEREQREPLRRTEAGAAVVWVMMTAAPIASARIKPGPSS